MSYSPKLLNYNTKTSMIFQWKTFIADIF